MTGSNIDILCCPLRGTHLIEANAGTGKTYTITALTVRMLVELDIPIEKILVVTFTKASVADLKTKIYDRLTQLNDALDGKDCTDGFINAYIKAHPEELLKKRIGAAIRDFDMNLICTIHGFCQKMLTENSFGGNIAFGTKLSGDSANLLKRPVQDFWRRRIYPLKPESARLLLGVTPDDIVNFVKKLTDNPSMRIINRPHVEESELEAAERSIKEAFESVKSAFAACDLKSFQAEMADSLNARTYKPENTDAAFNELERFIENDICNFGESSKIEILTSERIEKARKNNKQIPQNPLISAVDRWKEASEHSLGLNRDFRTMIYAEGYDHCAETLENYKMKADSQSYTDLIVRMRDAVMHGQAMKESLRRSCHAVMIDEFQDTDPYQYDIFYETFGTSPAPLFMIGDPKQAIYAFRGADVFTYLKAADNRESRYTLTTNHRSGRGLVNAVNSLFTSQNPFCIDRISYNPSEARKDISLKDGEDTSSPMIMWHSLQGSKCSVANVADACAYEITRLLNSGAQLTDEKGTRPVRPNDFAVLTQTNSQALTVRDALTKCMVPCVITGAESVFLTTQARQTVQLVAAMVRPYSEKAVRTALATDIFGYDAHGIFNLNDSMEQIFEDFAELSDIMKTKGVAPMFFRAAQKYGMTARLAQSPSGERVLTNFVHIIELAQEYEAEHKASPAQLLLWLTDKVNGASTREDEYLLKMDSDDNAVTITTIHKSKGLEYNIVFTPFLTFSRKSGDEFPKYHDADLNLVFDMKPEGTAKEEAAQENLSESLRLAYVALTRAKAVCYTMFSDVREYYSSPMCYIVCGTTGKGSVEYSTDIVRQFLSDKGEIALLEMPEAPLQVYAARRTPPSGENLAFSGRVKGGWQMNSFSRLVHSASSDRDVDQFAKTETEKAVDYNIFTFPKGAKAGNCLHECMEEIPLNSFTAEHIEDVVKSRLEQYFFDEKFVPAVAQNIETILTRELKSGLRLAGISQDDFVHEMEFSLSAGQFSSAQIAGIFAAEGEELFARAASTLDFNAMEGILTGFADLIFVHDGRFYILDWKSNWLGSTAEEYSQARMLDEMLNSHYYLQLYIYTLALHMHLKSNMPDYDFDTHMGGGLYIFMRGVEKIGDNGIYFHRPKVGIIEKMERIIRK